MNSSKQHEDTAKCIVWHENVESLGSACLAFGVFDGVHRGHQYLISQMLADAHERKVASYIVTFDKDPEEVLFPDAPCNKLQSNEERLELLSQSGASGLLVIPFTKELAAMSPDVFCGTVLGSTFSQCFLHVGADFRYGARAMGTATTLATWAQAQGGELTAHELLDEGGTPVTSTRIRSLLAKGAVGEAKHLLARPFSLVGTVVRGRGEGRGMGIPTANLDVGYPVAALCEGVYAGYALVGELWYRAAISVGAATTFGVEESSIEPHLLGFDGDIYGQTMRLSFLEYVRPMKTFESSEALAAAINDDLAHVHATLPALPVTAN
ncbi:MAG: riboflavin biosynthesis protein RibF [Coriobacteriales bacterium]|jgi:riboflavin kinase/FMN adenylyltransferase|nr:riboflavin biosynthesis protein RibF [Coriobacteriales bacterium]